MKRFFVNAKYQMKLPDGVIAVDGGIISPSKVPLHTVERRDLEKEYPHLATRYLDPQVYLSTLNGASARGYCANLFSYGWFPGGALPAFDSSQQKQKDWKRDAKQQIVGLWQGRPPTTDAEVEDSIRTCVEVQQRVGCAGIILPAPLTADPHSRYEVEVGWLDVGLEIAERIAPGIPRIAAVAISDSCLRGVDPWSSVLLDQILDQVTARTPEGVYVVIEMANEDSYYFSDPNTVGALIRLADGFKRGGLANVIVGYAGVAGLMAMAAGADAWTAGWYRGERRLRLRDFYLDEGRSVPAYYSHPLAAEFHMESDLDRAVAAGFLSRIADVSDASAGLIRAFQSGLTTSSVPEWEYRPTNVTASQQHFFSACVRETAALGRIGEQERVDSTLRWLESASRLANDLYKLGNLNQRTSLTHQHGWLAAFERYASAR